MTTRTRLHHIANCNCQIARFIHLLSRFVICAIGIRHLAISNFFFLVRSKSSRVRRRNRFLRSENVGRVRRARGLEAKLPRRAWRRLPMSPTQRAAIDQHFQFDAFQIEMNPEKLAAGKRIFRV